MARSPSPRLSRAQAVAVSGSMPRACSRSASCAAGSGSNRTGWQREVIVGSTCDGLSVSSSRTTYGGGSSSVFSSALAASSFMVSARSSTNTRWPDSNGVWAAAETTVSCTSRRSISCAPLGATQVRSGWAPCCTRVRADSGSSAPRASSAAAKSRAAVRLPVPAGPCSRYAWAGRPSSAAPSTAAA